MGQQMWLKQCIEHAAQCPFFLPLSTYTFSQTYLTFSVYSPFFLGSPARSPRKSPRKPSMVTSSFYGQKKSVYLTPLERKAIKESLPSPPPRPLPSPPSQEKKKNKRNVKAGSKQRKVAAGSGNAAKMGTKINVTASKRIQLPKPNSRFVSI